VGDIDPSLRGGGEYSLRGRFRYARRVGVAASRRGSAASGPAAALI
jgi:hypothetical protein